MKTSHSLIAILVFALAAPVFANPKKTNRKAAPKKTPVIQQQVVRKTEPVRVSEAVKRELAQALESLKRGPDQKALQTLFRLSRLKELSGNRDQIRFLLGSALMEQGYMQVAAFQFVDVIRSKSPRFTQGALEKLVIVADQLGDDTLLNYAMSRIQVNQFPDKYRDIISYRLAEIRLKNGQFSQAVELFSRVPATSRYASSALYKRGLALAEANRPLEAVPVFEKLVNSRSQAKVNDTNRVAGIMALARVYYQAKNWDKAIELYRQVPRDHVLWHDSIFEMSWAHLQSARFRSALSNFQTMHSDFYQDFFAPESLLLRGIVYLYICGYGEMEKTLDLYESTYGPITSEVARFIKNNRDPMSYYQAIERGQSYRVALGKEKNLPKLDLPYSVLRKILEEGDVKRSVSYLRLLNEERSRFEQASFAKSGLGAYGLKVINTRIKNTRLYLGELVKNHLLAMRADLKDFYEQISFLRYEMINGKKEQIKKRIAGKALPQDINEDVDRSFYVQNGFEYWPFRGEYWADELGNYQYLGQQNCE